MISLLRTFPLVLDVVGVAVVASTTGAGRVAASLVVEQLPLSTLPLDLKTLVCAERTIGVVDAVAGVTSGTTLMADGGVRRPVEVVGGE
jgi:hypothetical protein